MIMDLLSRKIIGWSLDKIMTTDLILNAFNMAVASRECDLGLILHSDQSAQYRFYSVIAWRRCATQYDS
jgi:putative transposase